MFCTNCGEEIQGRNNTCPHCGFDLSHIIALLDEPDEVEKEDELRSEEEIAKRTIILSAVISCSYGKAKSDVVEWLKKERLWGFVTPLEKKFLTNKLSGDEYQWKTDALVPMLWAIKKINSIPKLNKRLDIETIGEIVPLVTQSTEKYISLSIMRNESEIHEEYEKVYQAHWEVRDAQLNNTSIPEEYNPDVIYERHYGFNWLTGYMNQAWDDVTTDT